METGSMFLDEYVELGYCMLTPDISLEVLGLPLMDLG